MNNKNRSSGFTLVELMVALAIVSILLVLAWPSYQQFVVDSRVSAQANEFLTALTFTRSEAVKRNATVTMCKSADGASCATAGGWQQGWIVFVDAGAVGAVDVGDTILRVAAAMAGPSTLVGTTDVASYVSYAPSGRSQLAGGAAQGGTLNLCSNAGTAVRRDVVLSSTTGRAHVEKASVTC